MLKRPMIWFLLCSSMIALTAVFSANSFAQTDPPTALCQNEMASIEANFPSARANKCTVVSSSALAVVIAPENKPINDSAWYAFKVVPKQAKELQVILQYSFSKHRYRPKISYDGTNWELLDEALVDPISETEVRLRLAMNERPFYISAQEIFTNSSHTDWIGKIAAEAFVARSVIGKSVEGRDIVKLEVRTDKKHSKPYIFIVGRQHPPEVTGAFALARYVETLLGGSDLAKQFRNAYDIIIIPNMNPDGVVHGNWRHNMNGIDLNRDWGPFTQPETQVIQSELKRFDGDDELILFLDFHSTFRNLFYTQTDGEPTRPEHFTRDWLSASRQYIDEKTYKFTREQSPNSGQPTSKNYMYSTYGIPAITYEVGDESDRDGTLKAAEIFAQEMMKNLLQWKDNQ